MQNKKVFILSGPAGAGKNTVWNLARPLCNNFIEESISITTRTPIRAGEKDGVDYYFITKDLFEEKIRAGEFLEYAKVHSWYYGSPKSELRRISEKGKSSIYIIDVQGAALLKPLLEKEGYEVRTIFLTPPSVEEMKKRIRGRGTETEEDFQVRLASAMKEFEQQHLYERTIINDDLEKAKDELLAILRM